MREYPPDQAKRIVKPRKPQIENRPIIAVSRDLVVVEAMDDDVFPASELPTVLRNTPSSIVVVQGFGKHLERIQRVYKDDPEFQYRVTPIKRYARPWNDGRRVEQGMIVDAVCNYVGWSQKNESGKTLSTHYHYPLDPIWFLTTGIDELDDRENIPRIVKLYEWAREVRSWCQTQGLKVKASAGGLAAQLLRDSRFWAEPRRKAPRLINDIARFQLPGNYYHLRGHTNHYYRAIHLDMSNAHHVMASRIKFPDVNTLHAYGHWNHDRADSQDATPPDAPKPFAPGRSSLAQAYGLLHVRLSVPPIRSDLFPPPFMERPGIRDVYLYTNELELVTGLGGEILGIHAAYVSSETDPGLNRYAKFAIEQIRENPGYKPWLKPTLHAAYGLLAARPVAFETGFLHAKSGEPSEYHMGNASIPVVVKKRNREIETSIANVIHRGMIEAEVRKEVLWFARYLTEVDHHKVLAIYADALFVEDTSRPIRLLEPPWRVTKHLTSLRFHNATHFTSPQMSRLPGVPKTARESFLRDKALAEEISRVRWEGVRVPAHIADAPDKRAGSRPSAFDSGREPRKESGSCKKAPRGKPSRRSMR